MGGSKTYSVTRVMRGKKVAGGAGSISSVVSAVETGVTNQIVSETLRAVISYDPTIRSLVLGVEILKVAYKLYLAYEKEYKRTGDSDLATKAVVNEAAGMAVDKIKEEAIRIAVSKGWEQFKQAEHISSSPEVDGIIIDGVSSKLEEVMT